MDGRDKSGEEPDAEVIHLPQGSSRDHRPDRNQVMLDVIVEHQAGIPVLMQPLSGNRSDGTDCGQIVQEHISQLRTPYGTTSLVAESALYSDANLQKLAETHRQWMTRVPATVHEAPTVLARAVPATMPPLMEGSRYQAFRSTSGGVQHRWVLLSSARRQPPVQRTVNKQLLKQGDKAGHALQKLCRAAFACEADAQQALATFAHGLQATFVHESTVRAIPRSGQRGRPRQDAQPEQVIYHLEGARASRLATRQARVDQHSCCILATNALDDARVSPQALLEGSTGQGHAERGVRFLKDPQFLASSWSRKKPERLMALLMVMTVCLLVYTALAYRLRTALKEHDATVPNQKGQPVQHPTARWVFHDFVGIHVLRIPGQWDSIVLNLTEVHQRLPQLLGKPYTRFYR